MNGDWTRLLLVLIWFCLVLFVVVTRFRSDPRNTAEHFTYWVLVMNLIFFGGYLITWIGGGPSPAFSGFFLTFLWQLEIIVLIGSLCVLIVHLKRASEEVRGENSVWLIADQLILHVLPLLILFAVCGRPKVAFCQSSFFCFIFITTYLFSLTLGFGKQVWASYELEGSYFVYFVILLSFLLSGFGVKAVTKLRFGEV